MTYTFRWEHVYSLEMHLLCLSFALCLSTGLALSSSASGSLQLSRAKKYGLLAASTDIGPLPSCSDSNSVSHTIMPVLLM